MLKASAQQQAMVRITDTSVADWNAGTATSSAIFVGAKAVGKKGDEAVLPGIPSLLFVPPALSLLSCSPSVRSHA